jgi:hypothetical protein
MVLLDDQVGPFDRAIYQSVLSPNFPLLRVGDLVKMSAAHDSASVLLPHAIFVPPGYTSTFYPDVVNPERCRFPSRLLRAFRLFVLGALDLLPAPMAKLRAAAQAARLADQAQLLASHAITHADPAVSDASRLLRVSFVSRRPYNRFVEHSFMARQVANEDNVLDALRSLRGLQVKRHDFALHRFEEQLEIFANSDLLIGMHGAALAGQVFMPPHAGVLELWSTEQLWNCFEHLARISDRPYFRWVNRNSAMFRKNQTGDYTTVDVDAFLRLAMQAVAEVQAAKFGREW